ncbi:hypothetical protein AS593_05235 [Caulobacter vibrioides]|nr:hypothetical protein AS593_05235 [Caulobacter vibrioides]
MTLSKKLFGFQGRLRRRDYWLFTIAIGVLNIALLFGLSGILGVAYTDPWMQAVSLITAWPGIAVMVKRLHDRNRSGWFALIAWVPSLTALALIPFANQTYLMVNSIFSALVGIWILVDLGILDGTKGPNRYGASPKGLGVPTDAELDEVFA